MSTLREEFEEWFKKDFHPDKSGPYLKNMLLEAWQASRESLVVELPSLHDDPIESDEHSHNYAVNECKKAIESRGIKVVHS